LPFPRSIDIMPYMKYTIIIEKGCESGYIAYALALRGCVSQGASREQAFNNIKEAMEIHIEALTEDKISIPKEISSTILDLK